MHGYERLKVLRSPVDEIPDSPSLRLAEGRRALIDLLAGIPTTPSLSPMEVEVPVQIHTLTADIAEREPASRLTLTRRSILSPEPRPRIRAASTVLVAIWNTFSLQSHSVDDSITIKTIRRRLLFPQT